MDRRGYLLPPISNPDLPSELESGGDSFWISENLNETQIKKEQQKRLQAAHAQPRPKYQSPEAAKRAKQEEKIENHQMINDASRSPSEQQSHLSDSDDELFWSDVIDAVLTIGHAKQQSQKSQSQSQRRQQESKGTVPQNLDTSKVD
jgi:hypothetical protein